MTRHYRVRRGALALAAALLVAAAAAAIGGARPDVVDTTAKLGPQPVRAGKQALYRSTFTSKQGTMNKVSSTTTLPAGASVVATDPKAPGCSIVGQVVTCTYGNVAGGTSVTTSIQIAVANPFTSPTLDVSTVWQFKDPGGGQPTNSESYDTEPASASTPVRGATDTTANGDCLNKSGGSLSANRGEAALSFTTPSVESLLCVPLGLEVGPKPAVAVDCFPGRKCASEKLTSIAGATFTAGFPAQGTLVWPLTSVLDKRAAVVFDDDVNPPSLVPLCADVALSATNPACEVTRKAAGGLLKVTVQWLGNDPAWEV